MARLRSATSPGPTRRGAVRRPWSRAVAAAGIAALLAAGSAAAKKPGVVASFSVSPGSPLSAQTVTFTSTSVVSGNGNTVVDHRWDLDGDGVLETDTGAAPAAARSYPLPGTVRVSLQVTDSRGNTSSASSLVTVGNRPPNASFTYAPASPAVFQPVTFTTTAADPEGRLADLAWDLDGNGSFDNGHGPTATRVYVRPGAYVVGLRATDAAGASGFSSRSLNIGARPASPGAAGTGGAVGQGQVGSQRQGAGPRLLSPFPTVRIAGRITGRGTRVSLLRVDAPRGARVDVRCKGRGCPFAGKVRVAANLGARVARQLRVEALERLLPAGVTVRIFVTRTGFIGKYTRFRMRRAGAPARVDRCLNPGSLRPVACPAQ